MTPYSRDFLRRHCIFNYNGYYSSFTYERLIVNCQLVAINYNAVDHLLVVLPSHIFCVHCHAGFTPFVHKLQ